MQGDAVVLTVGEPVGRHRVEDDGELAVGFSQDGGLFNCRPQERVDGPHSWLHYSYAVRIRIRICNEGRYRRLASGGLYSVA
jgi:hypothetical protein